MQFGNKNNVGYGYEVRWLNVGTFFVCLALGFYSIYNGAPAIAEVQFACAVIQLPFVFVRKEIY